MTILPQAGLDLAKQILDQIESLRAAGVDEKTPVPMTLGQLHTLAKVVVALKEENTFAIEAHIKDAKVRALYEAAEDFTDDCEYDNLWFATWLNDRAKKMEN